MTRKSQPNNMFVTVDGLKVEGGPKLVNDFKAACQQHSCQVSVVLRHLMWEFVEIVRQNKFDKHKDLGTSKHV